MDLIKGAMVLGAGAVVLTAFVLEPASKSEGIVAKPAAVTKENAEPKAEMPRGLRATCQWFSWERSGDAASTASKSCACFAEKAPKRLSKKQLDYVNALLDARPASGLLTIRSGNPDDKKKVMKANGISTNGEKQLIKKMERVAKSCDRKHKSTKSASKRGKNSRGGKSGTPVRQRKVMSNDGLRIE